MEAAERMKTATTGKVPHFFIYAKGKTASQVEPPNNSVVNRLEKVVKSPNLRFETKTLGKFDHHMLMHDASTEIQERDMPLIQAFMEISQKSGYRLIEDDSGKNNHRYIYQQTREQLLEIDPDIKHVVDVLIKQLFYVQNTKRKSMFWGCFGDVVLDNLRRNVDINTILCSGCGKRIRPMSGRQMMCDDCAAIQQREKTKERVRRFRSKSAEL